MCSALWRLWCKALGQKASNCDVESDKVAVIRSLIFFSYLITNFFIIAGVVRHWNDGTERLPVQHQSIKKEYYGSR
jgi:hypothetical protein